MKTYCRFVFESDHMELEQFVEHQVFKTIDVRRLTGPAFNKVDCRWLRQWKVFCVFIYNLRTLN